MAYGKVAIISGNKILARFFELEAYSVGLETYVTEKDTKSIENTVVTVIDIDTVKRVPNFDARNTVIVSEKGSFPDFSKNALCLAWPASVERVRKIYEDAIYGVRENATAVMDNTDDDVVYFFKNESNTVRYREKQIFLSESESKILLALCKSSPEPVSREMLGDLLESGQGNIVDVYVCKLRKKLEEPFSRKLIFTVRNKGYKIMADMEWE